VTTNSTVGATRPPDSVDWRSLVPVGAAVLVLSTTAFFRVPLLPDIGRDLAMTTAQLGVITSMFAAGRLLTDLPAGRLLERVEPTALLSGAAAAMVAGSLILAAAGQPTVAYLAAFLLGIASAVANATGMHAFSIAVPTRRRGTSLAVFSTALLGGQSFGPLVGGGIASASSWRVAEAVAGATCVALVAAMLWAWWRRRAALADITTADITTAADVGAADVGTVDAHRHAAAADREDDRPAIGGASARGALLCISFAMFFTLGAVPQTLISVIGAEELGLGVATIGLALGLGGVCRLVGGFIGGVLADRVARRASLLPGLVLQALGVALVIGTGTPWWVAGIVLMSLASWSISVSATVLADLSPAGSLGPRLGSFRFVGDLGLIAGPLVAGHLYDHGGRLPAMLSAVVLLLLAAVWCAISVPETRHAAD
jgi:predicted MFS family arabinose efflux permease